MLHSKKGFTLIELLIVITIIGLLATFVIASFSTAQKKSRDARRKSDFDAIKKALALYQSDQLNSYFPSCPASALICPIDSTTNFLQSITPAYIRQVPQDPVNTVTLCTANPRGLMYCYWPSPNNCSATNSCNGYLLYACIENGNESGNNISADATCASSKNYSMTPN